MSDNLLTIAAYMSGFEDGKKAVSSHAVLGEVTAETKQRDCKDCKWFDGINTMTGLGFEWPCVSCRVDRWEDKNSED